MLSNLKARVLNAVSESLNIPALSRDIQSEMSYRQADVRDVMLEIAALREKLESLHKSMLPVVMFKGTLVHGDMHFADYTFAARAERERERSGFYITIQPDCNMLIKTITILNGVCDIVECRMCNLDMLPGINATFPYDKGEITIDSEKGFPVSPANRIYMRLEPRKQV